MKNKYRESIFVDLIYALAVGLFFGLGVFQLLRRDLIKAAMGFGIISTAINLLLLAVGAYDGRTAAYTELAQVSQPSDPLVQALILTAVVIGFGSFSMLLSMINVIARRYHTLDSDKIDHLKG